MKNTQKVDFIVLQEIQVANSNIINFDGTLGISEYKVEFVNPNRRSGDISSMWGPHIFMKSQTFSSRYFLAVLGHWLGILGIITIIIVNGPQSIQEKKETMG